MIAVEGRIVDPASGRDAPGVVLVAGRAIVGVDVPVPAHARRVRVEGVIAPALIDALAFRTDPVAARAGGIVRVVLMPDQSPPLDDPALVERAERIGKPAVWVHPLAAATRGLRGEELAEIGLMAEAGAVGVATGRRAVRSAALMYRLLQYAKGHGLTVVAHAEDWGMTEGAVATEGELATRLGLPAAPAFAEALAVARDIRLAEATGARLHFAEVTTAEAVDLVRDARERGLAVSAGVTVNHLFATEVAIGDYRTFARLSPPLRDEADRRAVVAGVRDGTISVVASGHDPRSDDEKRLPFADAAPGAVGQAFLLALTLGLARDGMAMGDVLATMTSAPAALFRLPGGRIEVGADADLVAFDPGSPWRIDSDAMPGLAGNTPFDGLPVQGRVLWTMKGGEISP